MNDRFKFRIWHKKSKEWCGIIGVNQEIKHSELEYDSDDLIYQQYTGLKDKNGMDVYEGDILNVVFNRLGSHRSHTCEIKWGIMGFEFFLITTDCNGTPTFPFSIKDNFTECEIIGNIFDKK